MSAVVVVGLCLDDDGDNDEIAVMEVFVGVDTRSGRDSGREDRKATDDVFVVAWNAPAVCWLVSLLRRSRGNNERCRSLMVVLVFLGCVFLCCS